MGDRDEGLGPLAEALAEQLGDTPFGDDRPNVGAGGDDPGTLAQVYPDPGDRAPGSGRRQRDDGSAFRGEGGAADEVHLAADPRVEPVSDGISHDLPRQVNLDRRVDRDHPSERADDVGVVGEID